MAATQTETDVFQQIEELRQLAQDHEADYREKIGEAREKLEQESLEEAEPLLSAAKEARLQRDNALQQIIDTAHAALSTEAAPPASKPSSGPTPKRTGGKPAAGKPTGPTPKHGNNRPTNPALAKRQQVQTTKPPARQAPKAGERVYDNPNPLPEVIWSTLDRDPKTYKKVLSDYEEGAVGLRVAEIKEVIDHEKSFQSGSPNLSPQIQQIVGDLRYMGLLGRNETDKRYFIVDGAELYGPPLNEDGTPMDEQEDGTFKKADGSIFKWPDKSPVKKRQKREKRAS